MAAILIIEDDDAIAQLYRIVFTKRNYTVSIAVDGEEGLEKAKTKPTLILLDVMMPKKNGMQVLEALKHDETLKDIPVFVISNLAETSAETKMLQAGALKFLIKSQYLPDQIVDMVDEFIKTNSAVVPAA